MIGTDEFVKMAKQAVYDMAKETFDPTDDVEFTVDDVYFVMCAFVLGSIKGTFSTNITDGKYYEVTYNPTKNEMYVDQYVCTRRKTIAIDNK